MKQERNIFAVCDLEVEYAYHFMEYLSKRRNIPFEVRVFTSGQTLLEFVQEHPVELLLISEKAVNEEIQKAKIGQILILSEGVGNVDVQKEEYPCIYKYQSTNQVLREALEYYGSMKENVKPMRMGKKKVEIVGVYSPVSHRMKTAFSLVLGQILAKKYTVLYLNLEIFSGLRELLEENNEKTMSDLLYYLHQNVTNLMVRMSSMVQNINQLDYLPSVRHPGDIQSTEAEEWIRLLQQIVDYSSYEVVIVEFGDGISDLARMLEQCSRIYVPVQNDVLAKAKMKEMESYLTLANPEESWEKMKKLSLPYARIRKNGIEGIKDLVWSELGDFVREIIRTEWVEGGS